MQLHLDNLRLDTAKCSPIQLSSFWLESRSLRTRPSAKFRFFSEFQGMS